LQTTQTAAPRSGAAVLFSNPSPPAKRDQLDITLTVFSLNVCILVELGWLTARGPRAFKAWRDDSDCLELGVELL
jgi:hypothetical protein